MVVRVASGSYYIYIDIAKPRWLCCGAYTRLGGSTGLLLSIHCRANGVLQIEVEV